MTTPPPHADTGSAEDTHEPIARPPVFLLGGGVNALAVLRSLGRHRIPVTLFTKSVSDIACRSRYVTAMVPVIEDAESIVRTLLEERDRMGGRPVLYFTSDFHLKVCSEQRERLEQAFRFVIAPSTSIHTVVNKGAFRRFLDGQTFPAPRGMVVTADAPWADAAAQWSYPVIVKPMLSYEWRREEFVAIFGQQKVMQFACADDLTPMVQRLLQHCTELLIEEAIVGPDAGHYSVYIYRSPRSGELFRLCVNKSRVWPIRNGAGSFSRTAPDAFMERVASELLECLEWVGVASVCFKVDSRTNRPLVHEINGRLPQLHGILQAAGIDLPYVMYCDALGCEVPSVSAGGRDACFRILTMDCEALLAYRQAGLITRREVIRAALHADTLAEFARDDWKPGVHILPSAVGNLMRALW